MKFETLRKIESELRESYEPYDINIIDTNIIESLHQTHITIQYTLDDDLLSKHFFIPNDEKKPDIKEIRRKKLQRILNTKVCQ